MRKSKKTASRLKYEQNHPTVSARLPKDKRDKLLAILGSLDVTLPQLLLHFIDGYEIKVMPIDEARRAGYQEAKNHYGVTYPCSICGELITITSPEAKEAVRRFMMKHGWGHAKCHGKVRRP